MAGKGSGRGDRKRGRKSPRTVGRAAGGARTADARKQLVARGSARAAKAEAPDTAPKFLVVGVGALGCAAAEAIAAAGVATLRLADPDRVERSNLHRQLLHRSADLGGLKVESAAATLRGRHPGVAIEPVATRAGAETPALFADAACVVDATDGIRTKFAINDAAVRAGVPLVHAGITRFLGQLMTIVPGRSACYRCLFTTEPAEGEVPSCQEAGVLGSLAGTIGLLQAAEAIRVVTGAADLLTNRLLTYDALTCRWREVRLRRNPACAACGDAIGDANAPG